MAVHTVSRNLQHLKRICSSSALIGLCRCDVSTRKNWESWKPHFSTRRVSSAVVGENIGTSSTIDTKLSKIPPKRFELNFEEYIQLKRSIRSKQRISGIPFAVLGLSTSSIVSAYMFPDMFDATPENVQLIMGMDPLMFCGICGVVSSGVGFVLGTNIFKTLWKFMNKDQARQLEEREKDFLERIQEKRFASFSKFEDDYYGESIKNLSDYRQWLRTQQKKAKASEKFVNKEKGQSESVTS